MKEVSTIKKMVDIKMTKQTIEVQGLPEKLPPLTSAYWIQDGVIAQDTKAKAA